MNVSLSWLRDLAPDLDPDLDRLIERLALRGAPVEGVDRLDEGLEEVVVARVEEAGPHPNADRLSLCRVHDGTQTFQVVCGASNVRSGGFYPFAPVGSTLPGGLTLSRRKIRGTYSEGMLCSPSELGLGTDHEGILELEGSPAPGTPLVDLLSLRDVRLDVEVTSNRPDLLSHRGIARELAPGGDGSLTLPSLPGGGGARVTYQRGGVRASIEGATVTIQDPDLCSRYLGAVIRGVRVGPSPDWLQNRIRAAGSRPINNVVDATNYVLLELGQPLHAFDLFTLAGAEIVVRRARDGEKLQTLDKEVRELGTDMLAICDAAQPVAIAGVMGGLATEVTADTTDVLLECALFHPPSVRSTRQALGMSTDASYRYERGVDPDSMEVAFERCIEIILSTAGGAPDVAAADAHPRPLERARIPLRPARVSHVLGVPFTGDTVTELLTPLGFDVEPAAESPDGDRRLSVGVPGYRSYDVTREVDLIEEVARMWGFDRFPSDLTGFRPSAVPDHPLFLLEDRLRDLLVGRGLYEVQTMPFARTGEVELPNPVSVEERFLRSELLESVLSPLGYNLARGQRNLRLFDIGTVFRTGPPGEPPVEETRVAVLLTGATSPPHWSGPSRDFDIWDVKALLTEIIGTVWPDFQPIDAEAVDIGDISQIVSSTFATQAEGRIVGVAGVVTSTELDLPAWASTVFGLEVRLPREPAPAAPVEHTPLPAFPGTDRDLSLLVPSGVHAASVDREIRQHGGALLHDVRLLDVYDGEEVPEGQRSLTYRLFFQSLDKTLKDSDVDPVVERVVKRLDKTFGITRRG